MRAELPRTGAAPEFRPQPEEPAAAAESQLGSAAKPEGRKRGRPKKTEIEGMAERKSPAAAEKRQKSLFDF